MATTLNRIFRNFNSRIEEPVRKHLINVYACLILTAATALVGAYINLYINIMGGGLMTVIPTLGVLILLQTTPPNDKNTSLRLGYLFVFSLLSGMGMTPLFNLAIAVDPSVIISALIGTVLIFSCFSLSVLFAPRGYWLFIAGPLSTMLSALFFLSLANIFFAAEWVYHVHIYGGLLGMCAFVLYDTTLIMEKRRMNDKDFINHSVTLFVDFMGIFKRILVILMNKEEQRQNSRSKNK